MTVTVSGMPSLSKSARMLVMARAAAEAGAADPSKAPTIDRRTESRETVDRRGAPWRRRVSITMGSPLPANMELNRLTRHLYTSLGTSGYHLEISRVLCDFFRCRACWTVCLAMLGFA